jgi:hypothetical protein
MMQHDLDIEDLPLKHWARQHCKNLVQHAIGYTEHPLSWDECNQVEARMLAEFERRIAHLTVDLLRSKQYMNSLITDLVGDTVRLLRTYRGT